MDRAALLLRQEPQTSVAEIAGRVGYDSASKFAAVFKEAKGRPRWNTGGKGGKCFRPNGTEPARRSGQEQSISL